MLTRLPPHRRGEPSTPDRAAEPPTAVLRAPRTTRNTGRGSGPPVCPGGRDSGPRLPAWYSDRLRAADALGCSVDELPVARELCWHCQKPRHSGLCASHRLDLHGAVSLGCSFESVRRDMADHYRQQAIGWVDGLRGKLTKRSSTGRARDRALAISICGRPTPVLCDGRVFVSGRSCNDRACPRCARKRARKLGGELREVVGKRKDAGARSLWFVTLTMPKPRGRNPEVAVRLAMESWRQLTNTKFESGRWFRDTFEGGVRALEVTWSPAGRKRKDGSLVEYSGWHAHFHLMLEGGSKAEVRAFVERWRDLVGGNFRAQDVALIDDRRIGQLTKYVWKPLHHDLRERDPANADELCRRLFVFLHGRRMLEGFGTWRGWRSEVERQPPREILWCVVSACDVAAAASQAGRRWLPVGFMGHVGTERVSSAMTFADVSRRCEGWLADVLRDELDSARGTSNTSPSATPGLHGLSPPTPEVAGEERRPLSHDAGLPVGEAPTLPGL